jgi:hypothetical protein
MKLESKELFFFNNDTHLHGANAQHKVVIQSLDGKTLKTPHGEIEKPYVEGYLQNEFNYGVTADWQPLLDNIVGNGLLGKASGFTGSPLFQSGLYKRKFYKGGGYISFNVDIRLLSDEHSSLSGKTTDSQGGGKITNPKTAAHWLSSLCLPTTDPSVVKMLEGAGDFLMEGVKDAANAIAGQDKFQNENNTVDKVSEAVGKPYARTIRVKIGNMFASDDMIIDAVDVKYSRQQVLTKNGGDNKSDDHDTKFMSSYQPLYVDISLKVSTRTIPSVEKDGSANTGLLKPQPAVSFASETNKIVSGVNEK